MPTQVQSLVTPVFEPIVDVTANTEVITEAQNINTAVAILNRVEYLRQFSPLASATPERFFYVRDDFAAALTSYVPNVRIDSEHSYDASESGSPAISFDAGTRKNPGELRADLPTNSQFGWSLRAGMRFDSIFRADMVVKVNEGAGNTSTSFQIGFATNANMTGTDLMLLTYRASHATWDLFVKRAGVTTVINLNAFVNNARVVVRFLKDPATIDIAVEMDGAIVTTVAAAAVPTGTCFFGAFGLTTVADSNVCSQVVDFIEVASDTGSASRKGL